MIDSWMNRGVQHFKRLGAEAVGVRVFDAETAHDPAHVAAINRANFVYLSGGNPNYLADCLEGSPVWDAIMGVHLRGGIVAGCSAGAMIMGEEIFGPGGQRTGFDLLHNVVIVPHFDEFIGLAARVMRFLGDKSLTMVGVDGRTALVVNGGRCEVLGKGGVTVFKNRQNTKYEAGLIPDGVL